MARFISDANKVLLIHESGTYGSTSGNSYWIGQVTSNEIDDAENKIENRYVGALSRNVDNFQLGPRDVTGTLTYFPQSMQIPFYAIGSVNTGSVSAAMTHVATEVNTGGRLSPFTSGTLNPPISFTIEDSKQSAGTGRNLNRTINGVIPNVVTINASQGERVTVDVDYIGKTLVLGSGATTSLTEVTANNPYLWNDCSLTVAGSQLDNAKSIVFEINNNLEGPHYLNGSRDIAVPILGNKDYTVTATVDMDGTYYWLYNDYYKTGSTFNATFDLNADRSTAIGNVTAGSQHAIFVMSGCQITAFSNPTSDEGVTESEIEIRPKTVSATEYQKSIAIVPF